MRVYALIPARAGSKGLRDKNILPVDGHPLKAGDDDARFREVCRHNLLVNMLARPDSVTEDTVDIQAYSVRHTRFNSRKVSGGGTLLVVQTMRPTAQTFEFVQTLGPFVVGQALWRGTGADPEPARHRVSAR